MTLLFLISNPGPSPTLGSVVYQSTLGTSCCERFVPVPSPSSLEFFWRKIGIEYRLSVRLDFFCLFLMCGWVEGRLYICVVCNTFYTPWYGRPLHLKSPPSFFFGDLYWQYFYSFFYLLFFLFYLLFKLLNYFVSVYLSCSYL